MAWCLTRSTGCLLVLEVITSINSKPLMDGKQPLSLESSPPLVDLQRSLMSAQRQTVPCSMMPMRYAIMISRLRFKIPYCDLGFSPYRIVLIKLKLCEFNQVKRMLTAARSKRMKTGSFMDAPGLWQGLAAN